MNLPARSAFALGLVLAAPAQAAAVRVDVDGIEPGGGKVYVTLCRGGLDAAACTIGQESADAAPARRFVFEDVTPGTYAVAAFQDENGNGQLDRSRLGLPLEPYGLSGEAGRRARPDFAQAALLVREPGVAVRLRLARALPRR